MESRARLIRKTVEKIRSEFEQRKINQDQLTRLYSVYSPNINPNSFVHAARQIFPKLNCGLASVFLQDVLGGDVLQGAYGKHNHTFLELGSGTIVDITADQYGGPRVYIGPLQPPWTRK